MYVTTVNSAKENGLVKKKPVKPGLSSFSELVEASEEGGVQQSAAASVGGVNQLLFLQEVGDEQLKKKEIIAQGFDILKYLDYVKIGLLNGELPVSTIISLEQALQTLKNNSIDPHLREIISEIELRAKVEIAKLSRNQ